MNLTVLAIGKIDLARVVAFALWLTSFQMVCGQDPLPSPSKDIPPSVFLARFAAEPTVQPSPDVFVIPVDESPIQGTSTEGIPCFDDCQIGTIAYRHSRLAQLLCREADAVGQYSKRHGGHSSQLAAEYLQSNAARVAQTSAEQAMLIHFSIQAILSSRPLLDESISTLEKALQQQGIAIEKGIPIPDPTKLESLSLQAQDRKSSNDLLLAKLRSQLSILIPLSIACTYRPCEPNLDLSLPSDLCAEIQQAYRRRCDLIALRNLADKLTVDDLELARLVAGQLIGKSVAVFSVKSKLVRILIPSARQDAQEELSIRKRQLRDAALLLERQIAQQAETIWLEWHTSLERYQIAVKLVNVRKTRVDQLRAMGELGRPMPSELLTAESELIEAQGAVIERLNEFRLNRVKWLSTTGQLLCNL